MAAKKKVIATSPKISEAIDDSGLRRLEETQFLKSGNVGVDIVLSNGKGIPLGANILLFGLPGTGKTTLICDILKRLLDSSKANNVPMRIHYIDSESSRELLKSTGVMKYVYHPEEYVDQQVIYHEHISALSQLEYIYRRMTDAKDIWNKNVRFTVIDSINKLSSEAQLKLDKSVNDGDFGDDARARKKLEKKWFSIIQSFQITQFWVSQMSTKQNVTLFEEKKKPAVTDFDMHNMDVILKLTSSKKETVDVKKVKCRTVQGEKENITKYIVTIDPGEKQFTKNRYGQNIPMDVLLWRGQKIINAYVLRNILKEYGLITAIDTRNFSMTQEAVDIFGEDIITAEGIKDIEKVPRTPTLNNLCSKYDYKVIEYLEKNNMYKMCIDEEGAPEDEDDGLYN